MSLEKLQNDVVVKLAIINKSLTKVEEYRKQLQENAQKVKENIHDAVDRQVGSLKGRERQLVRQVEVAAAHQSCLLSTQQAELLQSQGALVATKAILNQCTSADVVTLSKIKVDDIPCPNIRPNNLVSVKLNEAALTAAIGAFGSVQLPETITHHPSPVIPAKVEEYEDEDHDVLHKSVAGASSGPDSPVRVTVQFPRLSQQTWLIGQKQSNTLIGSSSSTIQTMEKSKCNVTSWLSNLQISGSQDEEDNAPTPSSVGSFELMSKYGSSPPLSSKSSSIEIVPSHFDSDKEDCSTTGSTCEIENVPSCLEDKSRWLSPKHSSSDGSMLQKIKVADACQANEPCSSFSDCLCKGDCADSALQKAKQSAAFQAKIRRKRTIAEVYDAINPVLSHMVDILSSDNDKWLIRSRVISQSSQSLVPGPAKKAMYEAPGEKWLCQRKASPVVPISPIASRVVLSTHSNVWLLHKLKAEKGKEEKEEKKDVTSEKKESSRISVSEKTENSRVASLDLSDLLEKFKLETKSLFPSKSTEYMSGVFPSKSTEFMSGALSPARDSSMNWVIDNRILEDTKLHSPKADNKSWLVSQSTNSRIKPVVKGQSGPLDQWLLKRL